MGDGSGRGFPTDCVHWATVKAAHRGGDMPEVNNIPPSLSYRPADPAEPVLDISIGDALRAATSTWRTRTALIDGTSAEQTRRRWTFEELLTESEKVARALPIEMNQASVAEAVGQVIGRPVGYEPI